MFKDFSVTDRFVKVESTVEPDPRNREQYRRLLPIFDRCYESLVDVYEDLARCPGSPDE